MSALPRLSGATSPALVGAAAGLLLGVGLLLVLTGLPRLRRVDLDQRLAPYLREVPPGSRLLARTGVGAGLVRGVPALLAPVVADVARAGSRCLTALSGSAGGVRRRLDQAGSDASVEHFRAEQVLWATAGVGVGLVLALAVAARSGPSVLPGVGAVLVGGVVGVMARDHALSRAVSRREERMVAEFPAVAELLALSVAAGDGAVGALERLARSSRGVLAEEVRRTLADAHAGAPLVTALERMAARASLPALARFVDGVVVAVERGTPLAEVLRAQAQDVREASRRQLLEAGGKKEIAMMVPVVFLVLPVTVLFAVYPGLAVLRLGP